jgi:hypothetical protein
MTTNTQTAASAHHAGTDAAAIMLTNTPNVPVELVEESGA